jgi:hypothetical protein
VNQGPPSAGEPGGQQTNPAFERRKLEFNDARRWAAERERERLARVAIDSEKYDPRTQQKIYRSAKAIGYPTDEIGARVDEHRVRSKPHAGASRGEASDFASSARPVRDTVVSEREGRRGKDRRGRGGDDGGGFKSKKEREAEEREQRELERQWAAKQEREAKLLEQAREREMPQQRAVNQVELPSMLRMSDLSQLLNRSMCASSLRMPAAE